jgi:signal transduction histidine kinase
VTTRRFAWAVWGLTLALAVAWPFLFEAAKVDSDVWAYALFGLAVIGYATVGALITSRQPGNRIGLLLAGIGLAVALALAGGAYAKLALDQGVDLPFPRAAAWIGQTGLSLMLVPIPLIFLLFPTGKVPSPRWRPLLWVLLAATAVVVLGVTLLPGAMTAGFTDLDTAVNNPVGLPSSWKPLVDVATGLAGAVVFFGAFLCVLSLVMRYRRAEGDERQQIRWLLYVGAVAAAIPVVGLLASGIRDLAGVQVSEDNDPIGNIGFILFFGAILLGIPAACGISILRYRLYDLDVVVKKTVVFGALALFISAVYLVAVFVLGAVVTDQASSTVSFAAGAAAAVAFQPLRAWARRLADRLVYGGRATPYEVLSEFSDRLADTYSTDDVLPRMASLLGTSSGATEARVWLLLGGVLSPAAAWPQDLTPTSSLPMVGQELPEMPGDAYPVRHHGDVLGAFTLAMPSNDPMNPAKARLVDDLAAQAGLVLRNVRLLEELRASRRRIVEAQDERAKKLERDIHDGAQQQLVALTVKLRLTQGLVRKDVAKAEGMLADLQSETQGALEDLRDLARGIYPPLLADKGLGAALEAQARKAAVPTTVESDGIGRYPQEVESAVYFCTLEALNNVAKYAEASRVEISLAQLDDRLMFTVTDDGVGFDADTKAHGTGLQGMRDRLDAIAGKLAVESAPGHGTTITGTVPVRSA